MNPVNRSPGAIETTATGHRTVAFWWNAYAVLLVATVGVVLGVFIVKTVPGLAHAFSGANQALPLSLRFLIGATGAAPWVAIVIALAAVAMRRARIEVPAAVRVAAIPAVAWLVVTLAFVALTLTVGQLRPNG